MENFPFEHAWNNQNFKFPLICFNQEFYCNFKILTVDLNHWKVDLNNGTCYFIIIYLDARYASTYVWFSYINL